MPAERSSVSAMIGRFVRTYATRYAGVYAIGVAALLLTNWINVLIPEGIQRTIDAIHDRRDGDWLAGVAFIAGLAVSVILTRTLSRVLFFNPGRTVEFRMKNDLFDHLMRRSPDYFRRFPAGELISRATNDMMGVRSVIGFASLQLLNVATALTMTLSKMVAIDGWLTLWCTGPLLLGAFILRKGIRALLVRFREGQEMVARLSDTVLDAFTGVAVIQSFNAEPAFLERFDRDNDAYVANRRKLALIASFVLPVVTVVGSLCLGLLLLVGGQRVIDGALSLGQIAAYASYVGIVVSSLQSSGWVVNSVQRGIVSLQRVYEVFDAPDVDAGPAGPGLPDGPLGLSARGLTYRYADADPADPPALADIAFEVPAGGFLGIFGPTGSGKTTLLNLVARYRLPPEGALALGGVDVTAVDDTALRGAVAVVPQDPYLFSRSVRENVAFADPAGAVDDERVRAALRDAAIEAEADALPQGLDTVVGERGVMLSGGQRQRTALARAFYRPHRVLLLDDVLSAVDHDTESRLIGAIRRRSAGVTTVLVSHRIRALLGADRIVVLDGGRIVDQGTHAELLSRPGIYAETWAIQQDEEIEGAPEVAHG